MFLREAEDRVDSSMLIVEGDDLHPGGVSKTTGDDLPLFMTGGAE